MAKSKPVSKSDSKSRSKAVSKTATKPKTANLIVSKPSYVAPLRR